MEILEKKKLEILFSWAQFYHNSEKTDLSQGLEVSRYPRHTFYENGKKRTLIPYSDQIMYNKVQEQIRKIGNK